MADQKTKQIKLYQPNLAIVSLTVVGDPPGYIGNGWSAEALAALEGGNRVGQSKSMPVRNYEAEANGARRLLTKPIEGATDGIPASAFKDAIIKVGFRCADFKGTELRAWLSIMSDEGLLPIFGSAWTPRRDICRVRKGSSSIPLPVCRPLYRAPWETNLQIKYDANSITLGQVISLVTMAGFSIGVGAWRPECDGDFGRFIVTNAKDLSA
jgi:hypothetical protein